MTHSELIQRSCSLLTLRADLRSRCYYYCNSAEVGGCSSRDVMEGVEARSVPVALLLEFVKRVVPLGRTLNVPECAWGPPG